MFHPGQSCGCWPVRATYGSLPCGRNLFVALTEDREGGMGFKVLQLGPTPTRLPTRTHYTPLDNTLASYTKCVIPVGLLVGAADSITFALSLWSPTVGLTEWFL